VLGLVREIGHENEDADETAPSKRGPVRVREPALWTFAVPILHPPHLTIGSDFHPTASSHVRAVVVDARPAVPLPLVAARPALATALVLAHAHESRHENEDADHHLGDVNTPA